MLELAPIMDGQILRESVTAAIRYWEPRRLVYNAVLAAIVLIYFGLQLPPDKIASFNRFGIFSFSVGRSGKRCLLFCLSG